MLNFMTLKDKHGKQWQRYTQHAFLQQILSGTLPSNRFQYYLVQDYVFLIQYAKVLACAIQKSQTQQQMSFAYDLMSMVLREELETHISYCQTWGISKEQLFITVQHVDNQAYTSYLLQFGVTGSYMDIMTALAPCCLGYFEMGCQLEKNLGKRLEGHPYKCWITTYSGKQYCRIAKKFESFLDALYKDCAPDAFDRQSQIFLRAVEYEIGFWDVIMQHKLTQ